MMSSPPRRRWLTALTLTVASLGSAITLAQLLNDRGGPPANETIQIQAGNILEILPVHSFPTATYNWVLTQDRTFIEAGRNASYNTRLINPGRFTLNADVHTTTGQIFRRIFTIDVQPQESTPSDTTATNTLGYPVPTSLVRTMPAKQNDGQIILPENQETLLLTPLHGDLHPLNLDLDPANDSDSDGTPTNDIDNAGTFFQTSETPLYLWFAASLNYRNIRVHATASDGTPITQILPVLSAAFAKEHQPPEAPLTQEQQSIPTQTPTPESPTFTPFWHTVLQVLGIAIGLTTLGFIAALAFYTLQKCLRKLKRYLRQRKGTPFSPPPSYPPARVVTKLKIPKAPVIPPPPSPPVPPKISVPTASPLPPPPLPPSPPTPPPTPPQIPLPVVPVPPPPPPPPPPIPVPPQVPLPVPTPTPTPASTPVVSTPPSTPVPPPPPPSPMPPAPSPSEAPPLVVPPPKTIPPPPPTPPIPVPPQVPPSVVAPPPPPPKIFAPMIPTLVPPTPATEQHPPITPPTPVSPQPPPQKPVTPTPVLPPVSPLPVPPVPKQTPLPPQTLPQVAALKQNFPPPKPAPASPPKQQVPKPAVPSPIPAPKNVAPSLPAPPVPPKAPSRPLKETPAPQPPRPPSPPISSSAPPPLKPTPGGAPQPPTPPRTFPTKEGIPPSQDTTKKSPPIPPKTDRTIAIIQVENLPPPTPSQPTSQR